MNQPNNQVNDLLIDEKLGTLFELYLQVNKAYSGLDPLDNSQGNQLNYQIGAPVGKPPIHQLERKLISGFREFWNGIASGEFGSSAWLLVHHQEIQGQGNSFEFAKVLKFDQTSYSEPPLVSGYPALSMHADQPINFHLIDSFFQKYPFIQVLFHPQPGEEVPRWLVDLGSEGGHFKLVAEAVALQRLDLPKLSPGNTYFYETDETNGESCYAVVGSDGKKLSIVSESQLEQGVFQGSLLDLRFNEYSTMEMVRPTIPKSSQPQMGSPLFSLPVQAISGYLGYDEIKPLTIALEGVCPENYFVDPYLRRANFAPVESCSPYQTQTCSKLVFDALGNGFNPDGCTILVNSTDYDISLACWLLQNPHRAFDPLVKQVLFTVDCLKRFGPGFDSVNRDLAHQVYYGVSGDEMEVRRAGPLSGQALEQVIHLTVNNFDRFFDGYRFQLRPIQKPAYEIVFTNQDFVVAQAREPVFDNLFDAGYNKAMIYSSNSDGTFDYFLARRGDYVHEFPLLPSRIGPLLRNSSSILEIVSTVEPGSISLPVWMGGVNMVRGVGSQMDPQTVLSVVEESIKLNREALKLEQNRPQFKTR